MEKAMLAGRWTYRSFRNETGLVGDDADKALALIFGEGVFEFTEAGGGNFKGGLGMGGGYALALAARLIPGEGETPNAFAILGSGIDGSPTQGWRYDYHGTFGYQWPKGVDQPATMLGTVVRVAAHGPASPAGVTAAFVAVRQADNPPPRTARAFPLTAGL